MEKRKHKFNIIDAVVIALVAAAAALLIYRAVSRGGAEREAKLTFVMQTDMIPEELSDNVAVGDALYDGESGRKIGEVVSCDVRPAQHTGKSKNGTPVISEVASYRQLYVTCETLTTDGGDEYTADGVVISSGKRYKLMFSGLYCEGECITVGISAIED